MKRPFIRRLLVNGALLLGVTWPAFLLLLWISAAVKGLPGSRSPGELPGGLLFYSAVFALPILAGGIVQSLVLLTMPASWDSRRRRLFAIATTAFVPVLVILLGQPASVLGRLASPLITCLVAYGLVMQLPDHGRM